VISNVWQIHALVIAKVIVVTDIVTVMLYSVPVSVNSNVHAILLEFAVVNPMEQEHVHVISSSVILYTVILLLYVM
jgi:hypothetical protein